jgi:hypothetical protein
MGNGENRPSIYLKENANEIYVVVVHLIFISVPKYSQAMRFLKNITLGICINLTIVMTSYCQNDVDTVVTKSIESKMEEIYHSKYSVFALCVNKTKNNISITEGEIKNPYHTLDSCFLFLAEALPDANLHKSKGLIGIYKSGSVIWRLDSLTRNFSSLSADVSAIDELNKDGKVEIVISQYSRRDGTWEYLWIFNWDGANGQLVTKLDCKGESTITCIGDFQLKDLDKDGISEIQCEWCKNNNFDNTYSVIYSWNGSLYGKWGKTSKYLLKGTKK